MSSPLYPLKWFRPAMRAPAHSERLSRQRIYILPTRHGFLFAAALLVMLLGSMNYSNSMGFVLTFLLGGMALMGILHTYRNLAGLKIVRGRAAPVFVGETAYFGLLLDNREQPARYAVTLVPHAPGSVAGTGVHSDIPANQARHLEIPLPAERRGRMSLPRLRISSSFPLGLFRAWSYVELDLHCLIYPHPGGSYQLPPGKPQTGLRNAQYGEGGEDFCGYRDYTLSDSPRHVDWKIVAREQGWYVKQFGGQSGTSLWLRWQDLGHVRNIDAALSQLCRWVVQAEARQTAYGLDIPGTRLPPGQGHGHYHRCLESLALYALPRRTDAHQDL